MPLKLPQVVGQGQPDAAYPFLWGVSNWIAGENPTPYALPEPLKFAARLAEFVTALHRVHLPGGPPANRGGTLQARDQAVREAVQELGARVNQQAVLNAWDAALTVPVYPGPPVWIHGDLQIGNLIVQGEELVAVIDFGGLGIGAPEADLSSAWMLFNPPARNAYRQALNVDQDTWGRARGWALSVSLLELPYYWESSPAIRQRAQRTLQEVLSDHAEHADDADGGNKS